MVGEIQVCIDVTNLVVGGILALHLRHPLGELALGLLAPQHEDVGEDGDGGGGDLCEANVP